MLFNSESFYFFPFFLSILCLLDDNSPTKRVSGGNLPVNVWSRYMKAALKDVPPSPLPGFNFRNDPGSMIPPADVAGSRPDPIGSLIAPRERGLFERLFGG